MGKSYPVCRIHRIPHAGDGVHPSKPDKLLVVSALHPQRKTVGTRIPKVGKGVRQGGTWVALDRDLGIRPDAEPAAYPIEQADKPFSAQNRGVPPPK